MGTSHPHSSIKPAKAMHSGTHSKRLLSVFMQQFRLHSAKRQPVSTAADPGLFNPGITRCNHEFGTTYVSAQFIFSCISLSANPL
jgi:hypothetical protein